MTTPVSTPYLIYRNISEAGSFFAQQQLNPTDNDLITAQVDPTAPQIQGLTQITNPIQPTHNAQKYVTNFDPDLYDLRDTSHLMRLVRALSGGSGVGGLRKQNLTARLASMLSDGSFLDLDKFYGAIFGLQRHLVESMPNNVDGTTVNPYTDLANSDVWDDVLSRDARYRSRLFQLARAVNMGATYPGLKGAAEAVLNCDVDIVESWVKTDLLSNQGNILLKAGETYFNIASQSVTYGNVKQSYGSIQGSQFGNGQLPAGNRGELIFTPHRVITLEERYQLSQVLNTLKPSHVQVTIAAEQVENSTAITPRGFSSDSENWQIQSRVTPALNLINPVIPIYNNTGPYSQARPVYSEYSGESWTYNSNVVRATSYRLDGTQQSVVKDEEIINYSDNTSHVYAAPDGVRDVRQAIALRLSGDGPVTSMPYVGNRINYSTSNFDTGN